MLTAMPAAATRSVVRLLVLVSTLTKQVGRSQRHSTPQPVTSSPDLQTLVSDQQ